MLLTFEKERINEEFSGDQYIIKIYSVEKELSEIINLYLEKLISIYSLIDIKYNNDPCTYFFKLKNMDLTEVEKRIASTGSDLCNFRSYLDDYLSNELNNYMPNTIKLIGYKLTLEFLLKSGGLKNLIKYPSSTLQILGAENAFFNHMRKGTPMPKYGILFNYPGLSSLSSNKRGKVARTIANKMAITIKMDYYKREGDIDLMKKAIENKMKN